MIYTVQGPDGRIYDLEGPPGLTEQQLALGLQAQLKELDKSASGGFFASVKDAGARIQQEMAGLGAELGLRDTAGAQQDIAALEDYRRRTFRPEAKEGLEGWRETPFAKFKETLGGSLPYMAAPLALGVAGGLPAAGIASLVQFTGSNLARQREEGTPLGQGNLGAAAAAAVPQAALDTLSLRMIPGIRRIFAEAGTEIGDAAAREVAKKTLENTAADYIKSAGKAMTVEGLTEAGQQALERLQAGLATADPAARKEYLESFIGGAVVGGTLGTPGRMAERSQIRAAADDYDRKRAAEEAARQQEQEEQERQQMAERAKDPAYLEDLQQRYAAMVQRHQELREATSRKAEKALDPSDFAGQQRLKALKEERNKFTESDEFRSLMEEMRLAAPHLEEFRKRKLADAQAEQTAQAWQQEAAQPVDQSPEAEAGRIEQYIDSLNGELTAAQKRGDEREVARITQLQEQARAKLGEISQAAEPPVPDFATWQRATQRVEELLDQARARNQELTAAGATPEERLQAARQMTLLEQARQKLDDLGQKVAKPEDVEGRLKALERKVQKAVDKGENPEKFLVEIAELQRQPSLFDEQRNKTFAHEAQLAEQMAQGREEAAARRQKVEKEIEALQRLGERGPDNPEFLAALERAMREGSDFVPPQEPGYKLGLPPEQQARYEKQQARKRLQQLKQKQGDTGPFAAWIERKRKEIVDKYKGEQAKLREQEANDARLAEVEQEIADLRRELADAQNVGAARPVGVDDQLALLEQELKQRQELQKQYKPEPVQPKGTLQESALPPEERPVNLSDVTDANVEKLLDYYLPKAIGRANEKPLAVMTEKTQLRNKLNEAQQERADAFFELAHFFQNVLRNKPDQYLKGVSLKKRFIAAAINEADLRSQYNDAGALTFQEKQDLRQILEDVADDLYRLSILRTVDNSYQYGTVEGFVEGRAPRKGAPTPEEAKTLQEELAAQRRLKLEVLEPMITAIRNGDENGPGLDVIRQAIEAVDARINEITAVLTKYISEGPTQATVIVRQRRGSDAPLAQRAIGAPSKALDVLEEQTEEWIEFYSRPEPQSKARAVKTPGKVFAKPALDNFDLLGRLRETVAQEQDLSRAIQLAGNPKQAEKVEALENLKAQRELVRKELARLREEYGQKEGLASKRLQPEERQLQQPEREQAPEPLPGQRSLPGMPTRTSFTVKPVSEQELRAAKTALVQAQSKVEELRQRGAPDAALDRALAVVAKRRQAITELEARQRRGEQQEAARQGRDLGDVEADKITSGRSKDYRSIKGEPLTKPKDARSWVVTEADKPPPISAVMRAERALAAARRKRDAVYEGNVSAQARLLKEQADSREGATKLLTSLAQKGITPLARIRERFEQTRKEGGEAFVKFVKDLDADFARAKEAFNSARQKADAAYSKYEDRLNKIGEVKGAFEYSQFEAVQAAAQRALDAQEDAERSYMRALADRMEVERLVGEELKRAYALAVNEDRNAAEAEYNKARAEREAVLAAERNAARIAEQQKAEKFSVEQRARQEQLARIRTGEITTPEGEKLPGRRLQRDTATPVMTAVADNLKKQIAKAETDLAKAQESGAVGLVQRLQERLSKLNFELDALYEKAPLKESAPDEAAQRRAAQPAPQEGMRLPTRKEGPAVRFVSGPNKKVMQSGMPRLQAAGLTMDQASKVSLYVLKSKLTAADEKHKAKLQKQWDEMTHGLGKDDIAAMLAEGERLVGLGPTAKIIAARERLRGALETVEKLRAELKGAKGVAREIIEEKLDAAEKESDAAETAYGLAKSEYETSKVKKEKPESPKARKRAQQDADEDIQIEERTAARSRLQSLIEDIDPTDVEYDLIRDGQFAPKDSEQASDAVADAIRQGRLLDALRAIVRTSADPLLREQAGKLIPLLGQTKLAIEAETHKPGSPAGYSPRENTIYMVDGAMGYPGFFNDDLIHEAVHAATLQALYLPEAKLTASQRRAKAELNAIYQTLRRDSALAKEYGLTSLPEFVAEIQSNKTLRERLEGRKWYSGNLLQRLWQKLMELIGFSRDVSAVAQRYVERLYMPSRPTDENGYYRTVLRRRATEYDEFIARKPTYWSDTRNLGLRMRIDAVDRLAGFEQGVSRAKQAGKLSDADAVQALYAARFSENHNQAVSQFITAGHVFINKEKLKSGGTAWFYDTKKGTASLQQVFKHVGDMARALGVDHEEATDMATVLANGLRAEAISNGWARLAGDKAAAYKALYDKTRARINSNAEAKTAMTAAMRAYKEYNDGLINFLKETGAISAEYARKLTSLPYAPWYRVEGDAVKLISEKEKPLVIGNIKDQPDLVKLLGDDSKTLNLLEGAVKNTYMITRMGMKNKQASEMAAALWKAGFASKYGKGTGPAGKNVLHFKIDGEDYSAVIDKDMYGLDAELIAMGLEGIKTTLPWLVRVMQIPANWVRKFVTRTPAYVIRQLARDPINAMFIHGMDPRGVGDAFKQMGKSLTGDNEVEKTLMRSLVVTSNIYANSATDVEDFLRQAVKGNTGSFNKLMLRLDEIAQQADAATRTALYNDALRKGMSHVEASLRALESMNFNRRGRSPTMHMLSVMVPFFNAQVQGLDVLYRAMTGKGPFQDKLHTMQKLYARGLMLGVAALGYALMMRDDEEYKKLKPQERYQNFLVRVPGVKDYVKIPIPYEFGVLFKALPEAVLDMADKDQDTSDAVKGLAYVAWNSVPKPWDVSAIAPGVKVLFNESGFGPIETARERQLMPHERWRDTTPEFFKVLAGDWQSLISPVQLEFLMRQYTGLIGLGLLRVLTDPVVINLRGTQEIPRPTGTEADTPFIGSQFQREGRYLIDRAYDRMEEIMQVKKTYDALLERGNKAEALRFAQDKAAELAMADLAGAFRQAAGQELKFERQVRFAPNISSERKQELIEAARKRENAYAKAFLARVDKTKDR